MTDSLDLTSAESALVSTLITAISQFTDDNCQVANFDAVYLAAMEDVDLRFFAWTDLVGGSNLGRGIWSHNITFTIGILFDTPTQMDEDIRTIVTAMLQAMLPENRLSNAVESARIETFSQPISVENIENNIPFVMIPFNIVIEEKMPIGC